MVMIAATPKSERVQAPLAKVVTETLSDGSTAYNVALDIDGTNVFTIGAVNKHCACEIAHSINGGAAWFSQNVVS